MVEFKAATRTGSAPHGFPQAKADVSRTPLLVTGNPFTDAACRLGKTPVAERALILNRIADRIMHNLGTALPTPNLGQRQAPAANPCCRHSAGRSLALLRRRHCAQEGSLSQIDDTTAYLFYASLGVEGHIERSTDDLILHDTTIQIPEGAMT